MKTIHSYFFSYRPIRWLTPLFSVALGLFVVACQQAPDEQSAIEEEEFTEFYNKFLNDDAFQVSRITFPLEGIPPGAEEEDLRDFHWQRADWQIHRPFDRTATGFETEFVDIGRDVMVERIVHESRDYGMMRRFARLGGEWYLIYYAGLNALGS